MRVFLTFCLCATFGLGLAQQLPANQRDPCDSKFLTVSDASHCDRYWKCENDVPKMYNCPNGLAFIGARRGLAEGCDYPFRGAYCVDKPRANPPISTEHCDWLYGVFGHETSCTRYWTCWNGTSTEQFCIGGLLYNEETHACDWPQNVDGCQKHPLCREDANANVPLGKSCERYWSCQGGYPRLQRCPATLVFDKITRRCTSPPTADCEVPITTPHPDYDDGFFRQGGGPPRQSSAASRRRGPTRSQQQEVPAREQFVDQPARPLRPAKVRPVEEERIRRPSRPRPSLSQGAIPAGAQPIIFQAPELQFSHNDAQEFRQPPIAGAIPLN